MKKVFVILMIVFSTFSNVSFAESQDCKTTKLYGTMLIACVRSADLVIQGSGLCSDVPNAIYTLMMLEPGGSLFVDLFEANGFSNLCTSMCTQAINMKVSQGSYMPLAQKLRTTTNQTLKKFKCTSRITDEEFKKLLK